jgi:UDP-2,3-diacylglucosamine hydrolase
VTRALFVSDLHLASERPDTNRQFFRFLGDEASRAGSLYILGDLFEYWLGDDEIDDPAGDPLYGKVVESLRGLSDAGIPVAVMHGNRDFLMASRFCAASGAKLLADPTTIALNNEQVLLMHGDTLCTDDQDYQNWRRIARSEKWQAEFLAQSLIERRKTITALREKSREVIAAKPADIMDVNQEAVREALRRHGVRRLIHGHTHRPARHDVEVDGRRCERWVLPDWYGRGGYLAFDDVGPRLVSF